MRYDVHVGPHLWTTQPALVVRTSIEWGEDIESAA
jgi:hypothetical protein